MRECSESSSVIGIWARRLGVPCIPCLRHRKRLGTGQSWGRVKSLCGSGSAPRAQQLLCRIETMSRYDKVVWTEGLFLCPQHFQQQERYLEQFAHRRAASSGEFFWGFHRLELDTDALCLGRLALKSAAGILRDGTPFDAPGCDRLPEPLVVEGGQGGRLIYLAVPHRS